MSFFVKIDKSRAHELKHNQLLRHIDAALERFVGQTLIASDQSLLIAIGQAYNKYVRAYAAEFPDASIGYIQENAMPLGVTDITYFIKRLNKDEIENSKLRRAEANCVLKALRDMNSLAVEELERQLAVIKRKLLAEDLTIIASARDLTSIQPALAVAMYGLTITKLIHDKILIEE